MWLLTNYNTLIDGCFESGLSLEARKLMEQMENDGVKPNQVTHNISLKWLRKEEKMEEVSRKVKELVELHAFSPDRVTYHTLINGYLKVGDLNGALDMMREMGQILQAETEKTPATSESKEELNTEAIAYSDVINELCSRGRLKGHSKSYTG